MRKRTKLMMLIKFINKTQKGSDCIKVELIDQKRILSHEAEAHHNDNESVAIGKIRSNSSYFFRYAKKSSVLREDLVQLRNLDGATIDDRSDICELLLSQFSSVFFRSLIGPYCP